MIVCLNRCAGCVVTRRSFDKSLCDGCQDTLAEMRGLQEMIVSGTVSVAHEALTMEYAQKACPEWY